MLTIAYIAHPISGDVARNIRKVETILEYLHKQRGAVWPLAPYLDACRYLDDTRGEDRERAFMANEHYFREGFIDELWICGDISPGVRVEAEWAIFYGIPTRFDPLPAELTELLAHV